jgi:hypothetical protein
MAQGTTRFDSFLQQVFSTHTISSILCVREKEGLDDYRCRNTRCKRQQKGCNSGITKRAHGDDVMCFETRNACASTFKEEDVPFSCAVVIVLT